MKNGFRGLDSDLHTMEPDGLWERYLEEPFRKFAPRFTRGSDNAPNQPAIQVGDLAIAEMSKRPRTAVVGKSLQERAFARHPHYAHAHARGYDAETHLQAMDIEGIDVAVIYGTRGRQVLMHDDRCAFLEGTCGWLPWYLWRLDEAGEKFGPGSEIQISELPSQYFFRQCYIATDADEKPLRQVVEAIGDDNIVVSTDSPHSDGLFPVAIEEFVRLEGVGDKTKANILWDNCARLYNLAGAK